MKKALVFLLTVVLLVSAVVPAYAVSSPGVTPPRPITTHGSGSGMGCYDCKIVVWGQRDQLSAPKKEVFEAAKACLKEAVPEGFACRQLFYHEIEEKCTLCDLGLVMNGTQVTDEESVVEWLRTNGAEVCAAYSVDMTMDGVADVVVKQYVNDAWVQNEIMVDGNNVVVKGVADAPVAIFMK